MLHRVALLIIPCVGMTFGCAHTVPPAEAPPTATSTSVEAPAHSALQWESASSSIRCSATGTELAVPEPLKRQVRQLGPNELAIVPVETTPESALVVKTSRQGDPVEDFLTDWAVLHRLVTPDVPDHATVSGDLRLEGNRVSVEYVVPEASHEQAYKLAYALFRRNGATCRIAAIERVPFDQANSMVAVLDGIRDTPGLEIVGARSAEPREDPGWALLRGILYLGARIALKR